MPRTGRFTLGNDPLPIAKGTGSGPPPAFDPRTVQSVASRCTVYANPDLLIPFSVENLFHV
jgi:hypothetical protein